MDVSTKLSQLYSHGSPKHLRDCFTSERFITEALPYIEADIRYSHYFKQFISEAQLKQCKKNA